MAHFDRLPVVCVLAGGLGTRLGSLTQGVPKGLVPIAGEPFLVHQLRLLRNQGVERVVICVGHLGDQIERALGTECEGVSIDYSFDGPAPVGTLGAIRQAIRLLDDQFLVMYGDTLLQVDFIDFHATWVSSGLPGGMTVFRNEGRFDSSNVIYRDGRVDLYDKASSSPEMLWIDYGLGALQVGALEEVPRTTRDLAELYFRLSRGRSLFGYEVRDRFYEIGTPSALEETSRFLAGR